MINRLLNKYRRTFWPAEKYARFVGVKIGKDCLISTKNFPTEAYLVEIGDHCRIASDVTFFTHGGLWSQRKKHKNLDYFGKIKIGNYTYVGEGSKIMPGVVIGNDVIVGAGTIVTKSVPDGMIAAGNPARIVGETKNFVEKIKQFDVGSKGMNYDEKKKYLLSLSEEKFIKK
ncbi:acyltransferase [Moheibacter sediminis]|uniref:Transferase hexapeptide (Six repeat-containing protein) n=1 Tax=Moheibacter sediminis TaxID=1434700 RepID=A0A1W2BA66_9FLAO|nr:acyltransferase [Moheibacter sediminis]SMC69877.1 transferase hexapeptide (six repeat-containing protein) [Moheibacter sediminis]